MTIAERPVAKSTDKRAARLKFRWPATLRLVVAVIIAGAATLSLALALPRPLRIATDIVGYPIYANFNIGRIVEIYYLGIVFFPLFALVLYLGQTWVGRRLGLVGPPSAAISLPLQGEGREGEEGTETPDTGRRAMLVGLARSLAVGASLGLEAVVAAGATGRSFWLTIAAVALVYVAWLFGIAKLRGPRDLTTEMARINSLVAPLAVLGLLAVSASTTVTVQSDGSVHHYPWVPWWVAVPLTGATVAWIWYRISASSSDQAIRAIERKTVLFVTGPLLLVVLLGGLPGVLGPIDTFHEGEYLVAAHQAANGALYWRDLLSTHGFFQDVLLSLLGMRLIEDSRWGLAAGNTLLEIPIAYAFFFLLAAWLFQRSWAFVMAVLVVLLSFMSTRLVILDTRFMFWPLILLLLGAAIQRRSRWMTAVLGVALAGQAILVPESAYCVPACGAIVILHDLYQRQSGASLVATFAQTFWLAAGGFGLFAVFSLFLLSQHALGDFFFYYQVFAPGHELTGGVPIHLRANGKFFVFVELAPVGALLLGFLYYAMKVIRRRPLDARDWVIGASALFALPYYTKFLERADAGHGPQAYGAAMPLILYLVFRACTFADQAIARARVLVRLSGVVRQPVAALLLLGALLNVMPSAVPNFHSSLVGYLATTPDHYHLVASTPPESARIGYANNAVDPATVKDLDRIFRAYLRPGDWVFDFSNEPALIYYLLDQYPHTRYYHVTMALPERAQRDLVAQLERDPPKLVVFNSKTYGLMNWDGIPNMVRHYEVSQYILDHYEPLVSSHTQIIYGLATAKLSPAEAMNLRLQQPVITRDLPFKGFSCDWGYAPNFLSISPPLSRSSLAQQTLATQAVSYGIITFFGWAGDPATGEPASQVVVTLAGKVVGQIATGVDRPDVVVAQGRPGFAKSGYFLTAKVPDQLLSDPNGLGSIAVYGVSARGVASRIDNPPAGSPQASQIKLDDGTLIPVRPGEVVGWVDSVTPSHQLAISPPSVGAWSDYRWLEIDSTTGFREDGWSLYDKVSGEPGRQIIFRTLGSTKTIRVFVGSCAPWHAYAAVPLMLGYGLPQDISAVRLLP